MGVLSETQIRKINQLFIQFEQEGSPGVALGIIHQGTFILKRGYGLANIEDNIPISSQTIFNVGSVAKQFTATCAALLIEQGDLSLEDSIATYFPQMPDYGHKILIRHLIYHTSGLRDYQELVYLKGLDDHSCYDSDFALRLLFSQTTLNFAPGEEERYSNSNYLLLGQIIQLVSGKSLRQFAEECIFTPLGMKNTFFQDNFAEIIPNRAIGYALNQSNDFEAFTSKIDVVGDGGLRTNLDDLLLWDQNFYRNTLGSNNASLINLLTAPGQVNDGTQFNYGFGLILGNYHGMAIQRHGGAFAGYCAEMLRFPKEQTTVICLANLSNLSPWVLAEQVAHVLFDLPQANIEGEENNDGVVGFEPLEEISADLLKQYVGYYDLGAASPLEIVTENGMLLLKYNEEESLPLLAKSTKVFIEPTFQVELQFKNFHSDKSSFLIFKTSQQEIIAAKVNYSQAVSFDLTTYTGNFYCEALKVVYSLFIQENNLYLAIDFQKPITIHLSDANFADTTLGIIHFFRNDENQVLGFWLSTEQSDRLQFIKLS